MGERNRYGRKRINAYLELVSRDQIKFLVLEQDIEGHPIDTLRSVGKFLGVDPGFKFTEVNKKRNRSPTTRRRIVREREDKRIAFDFVVKEVSN